MGQMPRFTERTSSKSYSILLLLPVAVIAV